MIERAHTKKLLSRARSKKNYLLPFLVKFFFLQSKIRPSFWQGEKASFSEHTSLMRGVTRTPPEGQQHDTQRK
jgi:hypothetical protein